MLPATLVTGAGRSHRGHAPAVDQLEPQYGHLFGDRLDVVAEAMDVARASALANVYPVCTGTEVVTLRVDEKQALTSDFLSSPDGIRTRATALRGRRARPLHNGALAVRPDRMVQSGHGSLPTAAFIQRIGTSVAGVLGLEPRLTEPESAGLPITPYPIARAAATTRARAGARGTTLL